MHELPGRRTGHSAARGIEALTGFLAAFINVRISAPVVAGTALAATFGAGVTTQLGAMRVNDRIDALESMAIRPVSYLISTRLVAGMVAITTLYAIAVILSFVASHYTTVALLGQSSGLYDHYFSLSIYGRSGGFNLAG